MQRLVLSQSHYLQILRHVTQAAPLEAVGLIGGTTNGRARLVIELPNLAGPDQFFADPFAQYQAEQRFSQAGLRVVAIYHSHPGGGTSLSESDVMAAAGWDCAHIVLVPERLSSGIDHLGAWHVSADNQVTKVVIKIET